MKPEHLKLLSDKGWRLNNLYWITDKEESLRGSG